MDRKVAKDVLHLQRWLTLAAVIVARGQESYQADEIAQEAGDSLMIKIGEVSKRLAAHGVEAPPGVSWSDAAKNREKLVHHYSVTDREVTWRTLSASLPLWNTALAPLFDEASAALNPDT